MTSAQLLTLLKDIIKADDDTMWSDVELYRYLTFAQEEIITKMVEHDQNWFEATSNISFTVDVQEYALPTDMFLGKLTVVEYIDTNGNYYPLAKIKKSRRIVASSGSRRYSVYGQELSYYITGTKIGFSPTPSETRTNTILVTYIQQPSDIDANTNPTLPAAFHRLIALKAAIYAKGLKDDDDVASIVFAEERLESNLFRAFMDRATEEPTDIEIRDNDRDYLD